MKRRTLIGGLAGRFVRRAERLGRSAPATRPQGRGHPEADVREDGGELTVIGLAGGRFPLTASDEEAIALTRRAVDLGINYFDTAHSYWDGHSEEIYGKVLPGSASGSSSPPSPPTGRAKGPRPSSTSP